ncbi:putative ATP-dependent helicase IRC3 [Triangularia verruculosa]|uniref:ATP-dependent helicase IRC3 n=1 Tax=Triangularia verruculosa TaxID=2587418 RepID=A0AAN7AZF0_9PEZI|nr:putative ATP-dependent helicase IRC3 [Triangularia verruculosa]
MKRILKTALRFRESPKDPTPSFQSWPSRTFSSTTARLAEQAPPPIQLRAYQEECIQAVLASISQGHKRLGISLATGSGKTVIFTRLIDRVQPPNEEATRTLILAHRRELVEQAARHCTNAYPGKTVDIELGKLQATGYADITVASLQSILSKDRLLKFDPSKYKLVLVDEAHHIVAPGYLKVLEHMNLRQKHPDSPTLVGVSATFSRSDGLRLGAAIDEIVYHKDYVDMINDKWLSDVIFTTVDSHVDFSTVKTKGVGNTGEFDTASLSNAVNTPELNDIVIRAWFAKAAPPKRDSTLVFCVDLSHVAALTERFRHHGIDARYVTGDTPAKERAETLEQFKKKEFPVLINCGVFTEGTDIPNIDCVVLARPTRSRNLLIQMIGRGMRLHEGKENCHVIDMVSSLDTGIITTPTLFGLDPGELVTEKTGQQLAALQAKEAEKETLEERGTRMSNAARAAEPTGRSYEVEFTEYDSVYDLISDTSGEKHIRAISQYTWVQINPNKYVLSVERDVVRLEREVIKVAEDGEEKLGTMWKGYVLKGLLSAKSPWATPREILSAETFVDAVHGCDTFVRERYSHIYISSRMPWRKAPASEGQLKFLNKLRPEDDKLGPGNITRGKAADMITKIKHGAKGRFTELKTDRKKRKKQSMYEQLEMERREREKVTVGPLAS